MGERTHLLVALAATIAALAAVVAVDEGTGQAMAVPDFGPALTDPTTLAPNAAAQAPAAAAPAGSHAPSLAPAPPVTAARPGPPARE
ncbi:hypothetical protein [Streptomyces sp. NPDC002640]